MKLINKEILKHKSSQMSASMSLNDLLINKLDIFCWCDKCNHNCVIKTIQIIKKLGPNYLVPEVGRNLQCDKCNNTKDIVTRPNWPSHGGQIARHTS